MPRVKQETIDEIRKLGMAKALAKANSSEASAEFREGVKRYFPKAKFGPKMRAAAAKRATPTPRDASSKADTKSVVVPHSANKADTRSVVSKPSPNKADTGNIMASPNNNAVARRVEGKSKTVGARFGDWIVEERKKNPSLSSQASNLGSKLGLSQGSTPLGQRAGDYLKRKNSGNTSKQKAAAQKAATEGQEYINKARAEGKLYKKKLPR